MFITSPVEVPKALSIDMAHHPQMLASSLLKSQNSKIAATQAESFREKMIQHLVTSTRNSAAFRQSEVLESEELTER